MYWIKGRDKYGRTNYILKDGAVTVGVLVVLPRAYHAEYGSSHLFNWWAGPCIKGQHIMTYFDTRTDGSLAKIKAYIEANV